MEISKEALENMQKKIKELRGLFHITVTRFADMLGVTRQTVYNIENGKTKLTKTQYLALSAILSQLEDIFPAKKKEVDAVWEREFVRQGKIPMLKVKKIR